MTRRFGGRRHRGRRGQALIEVAIASPVLVVLLAGGAQFGSLAFGQVTVDTAAREGARTAVSSPVSSLGSFFSASGPTTTVCQGQASYPGNPVCQAVLDSPGNYGVLGFAPKNFVITITANQPAGGPWSRLPGDDIVLASACGGTEVKGTVSMPDGSNASGVDVSASGSGVTGTGTGTNGSGAYTLCLGIPTVESVTIAATLTVNGCAETAQVTQTMPPAGAVIGVNLTLQPCPTPTPTPTASPTPSPSPSTPPPTPSSTPSATPYTCTAAQQALDGTYVTVKVSYPMPVFIPFVGQLFSDPGNGSQRTITSQVTMRVEPCTLTQGH